MKDIAANVGVGEEIEKDIGQCTRDRLRLAEGDWKRYL